MNEAESFFPEIRSQFIQNEWRVKENSEKTAKNYSKKGRGMNLKLGDVKLGKGGGGGRGQGSRPWNKLRIKGDTKAIIIF